VWCLVAVLLLILHPSRHHDGHGVLMLRLQSTGRLQVSRLAPLASAALHRVLCSVGCKPYAVLWKRAAIWPLVDDTVV
jgi:hypothetical protein